MLEFEPPAPRPRETNLLPMINVVFLLLIFFLISARLAPPAPFPVTPPDAAGEDRSGADLTLYLDGSGRLGFRDTIAETAETDTAVLARLQAERDALCAPRDCDTQPPRLLLRADAGTAVPRLAALLPALSQAGFAQVDLVTEPGRAEAGR